MIYLLTAVHLTVSLILIGLVLLQDPKGGGAGGIFGGGGSNSVFGSTGGAPFLTRVTRWSAIIFGITCLTLTIVSKPMASSVIDSSMVVPASPSTAPAAAPSGAGNTTDKLTDKPTDKPTDKAGNSSSGGPTDKPGAPATAENKATAQPAAEKKAEETKK